MCIRDSVNTIWVIGHTDCGAQHLSAPTMIEKMKNRGISAETIQLLSTYDPDFDTMLHGIVAVSYTHLDVYKRQL